MVGEVERANYDKMLKLLSDWKKEKKKIKIKTRFLHRSVWKPIFIKCVFQLQFERCNTKKQKIIMLEPLSTILKSYHTSKYMNLQNVIVSFFFWQKVKPNRHLLLGFVWEFIGKWNRMEWNDHKGMEINGMEWNVFK